MLSKVLRHLTPEQRDCEFDYILVTNYLTSGQLISHKSLLLHYTFYIKSEVFCAIYKKLLPVQLYQYHHFPRSSLYSSALLTLTILWCLQHFLFFYSQHHSASQCCYKISRFCPLQIHIFMCFWYEFTVISMAFLVLSYNIQKRVLKQSKSVLSSIKMCSLTMSCIFLIEMSESSHTLGKVICVQLSICHPTAAQRQALLGTWNSQQLLPLCNSKCSVASPSCLQ